MLVVKATTSDDLSFRGSTNGTYVFRLHNTAFKMGEYKYKFVVDAAKAGKFDVQWNIVPMLGAHARPGIHRRVRRREVGERVRGW